MRQPTQKRAQDRVKRMLEAAAGLLAGEGVAGVTTTRVAEVAGVPVGSVYQYFDDAEDMLAALHEAAVARITAACFAWLRSLPSGLSWQEVMRGVVSAYWQALEAEPGQRELLSHFVRRQPLSESVAGPDSELGALFDAALERAGLSLPPDRARGIKITVLAALSTLTDVAMLAEEALQRRALQEEALLLVEFYLAPVAQAQQAAALSS
ncbi:TetR/AcrR family transcriptional regulator [Tepidicaulis sp. LMO-SS28]|uniref:TetR/AcrR family transcriptional regulator n=1 Tax=Tepidicaulis sp. LMO-SS28 TaxID=3447455 RepID=UPI003EE09AFC